MIAELQAWADQLAANQRDGSIHEANKPVFVRYEKLLRDVIYNHRFALAALNDPTLSDGAARVAAREILDPTPVTEDDMRWAKSELKR